MTKYTVSAATLTSLAVAFANLSDDAEAVQPALPLCDGADQALEAFMEEREQLQAQIADLQTSNDQGNRVLEHVARFNVVLQERLNTIGIRFQAGADGTPHLEVNLPALAELILSQEA